MARNDGPPPQPQQNFGVWISRDEWKKQQVELKRGAEAYNQLLQEIEKKDRSIESLRVASAENLQARRDAEEKVRAPSSARPARARLLPPRRPAAPLVAAVLTSRRPSAQSAMFKVEVDKVHSELEVGRHVPAEPVRTLGAAGWVR